MLGFQKTSSGGDFLPIVKFDARSGRMFRVDRVQGSDGDWNSHQEDITGDFVAVFDFTNVEVGWICLSGSQPSFAVAPVGQPQPVRPNIDHRQGFRMPVLLDVSCGGGVHEFSSQAKSVLRQIDELHDAYLAAPESKEGKQPIVKLLGTTPIETRHPMGTTVNYAPNFKIVGWVDRPAAFDEANCANGTTEPAATTPVAPPMQTAENQPPVQQVSPPPAMTNTLTEPADDADPINKYDFG